MIIAWGVFILGCFCSILFLLGIFIKDLRAQKDGFNFMCWFVTTLCAAQYIWG